MVPDIDIDFDAARREEVIQYLYDRYGPAHTAMACTFVTFRRRSALRDVGKALGLSPQVIAAAMEALDGEPADLRPDDERPVALLLDLCRQIDGFPRHLGIHSGGMIITGSPLMSRVPTEPATMPERVVVQWDKESLEDVGLVKIDILGLRMLSAISETLSLIGQTDGQVPDLAALTADDPAVYAMISQSDTLGVFQVESRAQTQMLPKLQPRNFADLVVAISLIRPGPIQGNMVHPYLRRRQGSEAVSYEHPLLEPALAETLGVILFQEQVLKVARDLAGFTAGQGELLRRALGSKRGTDRIERLRESFLEGAAGQGVSRETAQAVFDQLRAFGGYSFAKSHAAAFAVLVYQSAWLKRYYFAHFYTALLNNQPMGFWTPAVLVNEAQRQGVVVRPVDVNQSEARCAVVEGGIRLGFNYVSGLGEAAARIILARADGTYQGLADFCRRTRIPRRLVENLIAAGGFDAWEQPRRQLLWELGRLAYQEEMLALEYPPETPSLPALTPAGAMMMEHAVLGLSTGDHVMTLYRDRLRAAGILSTRQARGQRNGQRIELAGLMVVHQAPPTAKGFHFLTLEDETGLVDVVVRPGVYGRYRQVVQSTRLLRVKGVVERQEHIMALLAVALHPL